MSRRHKPNRREPIGGKVVIEISPSSAKKNTRFKNPTCKLEKNEEEAEDGTPLRPAFCMKKNADLKRIEEMEDCFILDFNPFDPIDIAKLSVANGGDDVDLSLSPR